MSESPDNNWLALIYNEQNRNGSEIDVENLKQCFEQFRNMEVEIFLGPKDKMLEKIKELSNDPSKFEQYNGVIVVVMCHSSDTNFIYKNIFNPLHNLDVLEDKPLLLISQSCRGNADLLNHEADGPVLKHLIWFSAADGIVAIRKSNGSPFIQGVCESLLAGAKKNQDLATIIRTSQFDEQIMPHYKVFFNECKILIHLPQLKDA